MTGKHVWLAAALAITLFAGAGRVDALSNGDKAEEFQRRVDMAARAMLSSPRLEDLSLDRRRGIVQFVAGNMLFALLHEIGHTHITEMGLPVLGRDEDAADSFAVVTMLKVGSGFSRDVLANAAMGWFLSAFRDEKEGVKLSFYDVHGLDRQRAYQIVCLMVGSDPEKFQVLANRVEMPESRQSTCRGDYSNASWSWDTLMKPHLRSPDQPKTPIKVTYGTGEGDLHAFEESFRAVRLLETVAEQAADEFTWRRPFELQMQTCGEPGANWDVALRRLTLCYELAAEFTQLYRQYGEQVMFPSFR
jgi:hypothetical protein